ncbi:MAG: AraC family transcriptional regulator [Tissierellia bacterium]|nr:AraC family transcriptional regulator [Tissierellia bacterium]
MYFYKNDNKKNNDLMNHLYGRSRKILEENSDCHIYEYGDSKNPSAIITRYRIFPGVKVLFNDIHLSSIEREYLETDMGDKCFEINHCREGRFECELKDGTATYMKAGDFSISLVNNSSAHSFFPIRHYHGLTIWIEPNQFEEDILFLEKILDLNFNRVLESLCSDNGLFIKRASKELEHIFYEIYRVPSEILIPYLRVKIQELFIYMTLLKDYGEIENRQYIPKSNVDIVRKINEFINSEFKNNYTYEELSNKFSIKISTMKQCYKNVYGESINDTLRKKKLEESCKLLRSTDKLITDIAVEIGYSDHSKFSNAFKKMYNITPSEYRKITDMAHIV